MKTLGLCQPKDGSQVPAPCPVSSDDIGSDSQADPDEDKKEDSFNLHGSLKGFSQDNISCESSKNFILDKELNSCFRTGNGLCNGFINSHHQSLDLVSSPNRSQTSETSDSLKNLSPLRLKVSNCNEKIANTKNTHLVQSSRVLSSRCNKTIKRPSLECLVARLHSRVDEKLNFKQYPKPENFGEIEQHDKAGVFGKFSLNVFRDGKQNFSTKSQAFVGSNLNINVGHAKVSETESPFNYKNSADSEIESSHSPKVKKDESVCSSHTLVTCSSFAQQQSISEAVRKRNIVDRSKESPVTLADNLGRASEENAIQSLIEPSPFLSTETSTSSSSESIFKGSENQSSILSYEKKQESARAVSLLACDKVGSGKKMEKDVCRSNENLQKSQYTGEEEGLNVCTTSYNKSDANAILDKSKSLFVFDSCLDYSKKNVSVSDQEEIKRETNLKFSSSTINCSHKNSVGKLRKHSKVESNIDDNYTNAHLDLPKLESLGMKYCEKPIITKIYENSPPVIENSECGSTSKSSSNCSRISSEESVELPKRFEDSSSKKKTFTKNLGLFDTSSCDKEESDTSDENDNSCHKLINELISTLENSCDKEEDVSQLISNKSEIPVQILTSNKNENIFPDVGFDISLSESMLKSGELGDKDNCILKKGKGANNNSIVDSTVSSFYMKEAESSYTYLSSSVNSNKQFDKGLSSNCAKSVACKSENYVSTVLPKICECFMNCDESNPRSGRCSCLLKGKSNASLIELKSEPDRRSTEDDSKNIENFTYTEICKPKGLSQGSESLSVDLPNECSCPKFDDSSKGSGFDCPNKMAPKDPIDRNTENSDTFGDGCSTTPMFPDTPSDNSQSEMMVKISDAVAALLSSTSKEDGSKIMESTSPKSSENKDSNPKLFSNSNSPPMNSTENTINFSSAFKILDLLDDSSKSSEKASSPSAGESNKFDSLLLCNKKGSEHSDNFIVNETPQNSLHSTSVTTTDKKLDAKSFSKVSGGESFVSIETIPKSSVCLESEDDSKAFGYGEARRISSNSFDDRNVEITNKEAKVSSQENLSLDKGHRILQGLLPVSQFQSRVMLQDPHENPLKILDQQTEDNLDSQRPRLGNQLDSQDALYKNKKDSQGSQTKDQLSSLQSLTGNQLNFQETYSGNQLSSLEYESGNQLNSEEMKYEKQLGSEKMESENGVDSHDLESEDQLHSQALRSENKLDLQEPEFGKQFDSQELESKNQLNSLKLESENQWNSQKVEFENLLDSQEPESQNQFDSEELKLLDQLDSQRIKSENQLDSQDLIFENQFDARDVESENQLDSQKVGSKIKLDPQRLGSVHELDSQEVKFENQFDSRKLVIEKQLESHELESKKQLDSQELKFEAQLNLQELKSESQLDSQELEAEDKMESQDPHSKDQLIFQEPQPQDHSDSLEQVKNSFDSLEMHVEDNVILQTPITDVQVHSQFPLSENLVHSKESRVVHVTKPIQEPISEHQGFSEPTLENKLCSKRPLNECQAYSQEAKGENIAYVHEPMPACEVFSKESPSEYIPCSKIPVPDDQEYSQQPRTGDSLDSKDHQIESLEYVQKPLPESQLKLHKSLIKNQVCSTEPTCENEVSVQNSYSHKYVIEREAVLGESKTDCQAFSDHLLEEPTENQVNFGKTFTEICLQKLQSSLISSENELENGTKSRLSEIPPVPSTKDILSEASPSSKNLEFSNSTPGNFVMDCDKNKVHVTSRNLQGDNEKMCSLSLVNEDETINATVSEHKLRLRPMVNIPIFKIFSKKYVDLVVNRECSYHSLQWNNGRYLSSEHATIAKNCSNSNSVSTGLETNNPNTSLSHEDCDKELTCEEDNGKFSATVDDQDSFDKLKIHDYLGLGCVQTKSKSHSFSKVEKDVPLKSLEIFETNKPSGKPLDEVKETEHVASIIPSSFSIEAEKSLPLLMGGKAQSQVSCESFQKNQESCHIPDGKISFIEFLKQERTLVSGECSLCVSSFYKDLACHASEKHTCVSFIPVYQTEAFIHHMRERIGNVIHSYSDDSYGNPLYICQCCFCILKTMNCVRLHLNIHKQVYKIQSSSEPCKCDRLCFSYPDQKWRNLLQDSKYECSFCHYLFACENGLIAHLKVVHCFEMLCRECGKELDLNCDKNLIDHNSYHSHIGTPSTTVLSLDETLVEETEQTYFSWKSLDNHLNYLDGKVFRLQPIESRSDSPQDRSYLSLPMKVDPLYATMPDNLYLPPASEMQNYLKLKMDSKITDQGDVNGYVSIGLDLPVQNILRKNFSKKKLKRGKLSSQQEKSSLPLYLNLRSCHVKKPKCLASAHQEDDEVRPSRCRYARQAKNKVVKSSKALRCKKVEEEEDLLLKPSRTRSGMKVLEPLQEVSEEEPTTVPSDSNVISGEWVNYHTYVCCSCGAVFLDLAEIMDHKWESHPGVWCAHTMIQGQSIVPKMFYEQYLPPPSQSFNLTSATKSLPRNSRQKVNPVMKENLVCSQCKTKFSNQESFHFHLIDCGGLNNIISSKKKSKKGLRFRRRKGQGVPSRRYANNSLAPTPLKNSNDRGSGMSTPSKDVHHSVMTSAVTSTSVVKRRLELAVNSIENVELKSKLEAILAGDKKKSFSLAPSERKRLRMKLRRKLRQKKTRTTRQSLMRSTDVENKGTTGKVSCNAKENIREVKEKKEVLKEEKEGTKDKNTIFKTRKKQPKEKKSEPNVVTEEKSVESAKKKKQKGVDITRQKSANGTCKGVAKGASKQPGKLQKTSPKKGKNIIHKGMKKLLGAIKAGNEKCKLTSKTSSGGSVVKKLKQNVPFVEKKKVSKKSIRTEKTIKLFEMKIDKISVMKTDKISEVKLDKTSEKIENSEIKVDKVSEVKVGKISDVKSNKNSAVKQNKTLGLKRNKIPGVKPNKNSEAKASKISEAKPNKISEGKFSKVLEIKTNKIAVVKPNKISEGKPNKISVARPNIILEGKPSKILEVKPNKISEITSNKPSELKSDKISEVKQNKIAVKKPVVNLNDKLSDNSVKTLKQKSVDTSDEKIKNKSICRKRKSQNMSKVKKVLKSRKALELIKDINKNRIPIQPEDVPKKAPLDSSCPEPRILRNPSPVKLKRKTLPARASKSSTLQPPRAEEHNDYSESNSEPEVIRDFRRTRMVGRSGLRTRKKAPPRYSLRPSLVKDDESSDDDEQVVVKNRTGSNRKYNIGDDEDSLDESEALKSDGAVAEETNSEDKVHGVTSRRRESQSADGEKEKIEEPVIKKVEICQKPNRRKSFPPFKSKSSKVNKRFYYLAQKNFARLKFACQNTDSESSSGFEGFSPASKRRKNLIANSQNNPVLPCKPSDVTLTGKPDQCKDIKTNPQRETVLEDDLKIDIKPLPKTIPKILSEKESNCERRGGKGLKLRKRKKTLTPEIIVSDSDSSSDVPVREDKEDKETEKSKPIKCTLAEKSDDLRPPLLSPDNFSHQKSKVIKRKNKKDAGNKKKKIRSNIIEQNTKGKSQSENESKNETEVLKVASSVKNKLKSKRRYSVKKQPLTSESVEVVPVTVKPRTKKNLKEVRVLSYKSLNTKDSASITDKWESSKKIRPNPEEEIIQQKYNEVKNKIPQSKRIRTTLDENSPDVAKSPSKRKYKKKKVSSELINNVLLNNESIGFLCTDCGLSFDSALSREDHRQDCRNIAFEMSLMAEDHLYECPHCQLTFALRGTQRKHIASCRISRSRKQSNRRRRRTISNLQNNSTNSSKQPVSPVVSPVVNLNLVSSSSDANIIDPIDTTKSDQCSQPKMVMIGNLIASNCEEFKGMKEVCALLIELKLGTNDLRSLLSSGTTHGSSTIIQLQGMEVSSQAEENLVNYENLLNILDQVSRFDLITLFKNTAKSLHKSNLTERSKEERESSLKEVRIAIARSDLLKALSSIEDLLKEAASLDTFLKKQHMLQAMKQTFQAGTGS